MVQGAHPCCDAPVEDEKSTTVSIRRLTEAPPVPTSIVSRTHRVGFKRLARLAAVPVVVEGAVVPHLVLRRHSRGLMCKSLS
jgi:hypothetical protein